MSEYKTGFEKLEEAVKALEEGHTCTFWHKLADRDGCGSISCEDCRKTSIKNLSDIIEQAKSETFMRPRYEHGTPFKFGDELKTTSGTPYTPNHVDYKQGSFLIGDGHFCHCSDTHGEAIISSASKQEDSRAKLEADKQKSCVHYWECGIAVCDTCDIIDGKNPKTHYGVDSCSVAQGMDIARRERKLDKAEKKAFDWDAFADKKIHVVCNTEKADKDFRKKLHERGYKWTAGQSLLDLTYFRERGVGKYIATSVHPNTVCISHALGIDLVEWRKGMGK